MEKILYTKYLCKNKNNDICFFPNKFDFKKHYNRQIIKLNNEGIQYGNYYLYKALKRTDDLLQFESFYYHSKEIKEVYVNYIDKFIHLIIYIDNSYQLIESSEYTPISFIQIGMLSDNSISYNMYSYLKSFL